MVYRLALALALFAIGGTTFAQETKIQKAAEKGANKIIVVDSRGKKEADKKALGKPDLLFFKDGFVAEAWDLKLVGIMLEYNVLRGDGEKVVKRRQKYEVVNIQFGRTLQDFIDAQEQAKTSQTPVVAPAKKQPIRQQELLAGKFLAKQGRYTKWSFTFTSELNKYYPSARNATEYGIFALRSRMEQAVSAKEVHKNDVIAKGKYFLYAPGTFGNTDWVLNLTDVSYTENDISPRQSIYTERLRDEVFILKLSKDYNVFHLEWANQEGWQWTSPTQQTFYRSKQAGTAGTAPKDTKASARAQSTGKRSTQNTSEKIARARRLIEAARKQDQARKQDRAKGDLARKDDDD